ncbi:hypothetical protein H3J60_004541 [Salmonella enterica]|nr:hypothetical protein [Salmonella enterica]
MAIKRDFIITELLIYPYPEIREAVTLLNASTEALSQREIRAVLEKVTQALNVNDHPATPHVSLQHLQARLKSELF